MATKILAMNVLLALGVCVVAVTLGVLLTPSVTSADILEWLTTTPCGGPAPKPFRAAYSPK